MGTSDLSSSENPDAQCGLVPRFLSDLFENLNSFEMKEKVQTKVLVSFLEIYGEDIYDLLTTTNVHNGADGHKSSLCVREGEDGGVFVQVRLLKIFLPFTSLLISFFAFSYSRVYKRWKLIHLRVQSTCSIAALDTASQRLRYSTLF